MMKRLGVKRMSPEAVQILEKSAEHYILDMIDALKEEMAAHGRKTLKKEDVVNALGTKKETEEWEI
jgi:histone H3/H4